MSETDVYTNSDGEQSAQIRQNLLKIYANKFLTSHSLCSSLVNLHISSSKLRGDIMQQLLEILVKNLVKNENDVEITKQEQDSSITFVVKVNSEDIGKVIGKNGKMASSIRTIIKSVGAKEHKKIYVKFGD